MGIPDADTGLPKPETAQSCTPIIVDGVERACLPPGEFEKWMRRNLP